MANRLLTYEKKDTWIDALCGVTKLVFFLSWSLTSMLTYDTRVLVAMILISLVVFKISKTQWRQVGTVFKFVMFFMVINLLAIYMFSPGQGTEIYGSRTVLWGEGFYALTAEQLFYELNVLLKYCTIVPSVFIFIVTTNPSEFAASLNRIGVSYNIGYAIAIALRYIPDIQDDFHKIRNAQEARGIEMSAKAKLMDRIRNNAAIIFPLIFTSLGRIDNISNAMELRGYGKMKKRTWYRGRKLQKNDYLVLAAVLLFTAGALYITFADGSRFWYPGH